MKLVAKLFIYIGAYFVLVVLAQILKMREQMTSNMVLGFLAALIAWRIVDGQQ